MLLFSARAEMACFSSYFPVLFGLCNIFVLTILRVLLSFVTVQKHKFHCFFMFFSVFNAVAVF